MSNTIGPKVSRFTVPAGAEPAHTEHVQTTPAATVTEKGDVTSPMRPGAKTLAQVGALDVQTPSVGAHAQSVVPRGPAFTLTATEQRAAAERAIGFLREGASPEAMSHVVAAAHRSPPSDRSPPTSSRSSTE